MPSKQSYYFSDFIHIDSTIFISLISVYALFILLRGYHLFFVHDVCDAAIYLGHDTIVNRKNNIVPPENVDGIFLSRNDAIYHHV